MHAYIKTYLRSYLCSFGSPTKFPPSGSQKSRMPDPQMFDFWKAGSHGIRKSATPDCLLDYSEIFTTIAAHVLTQTALATTDSHNSRRRNRKTTNKYVQFNMLKQLFNQAILWAKNQCTCSCAFVGKLKAGINCELGYAPYPLTVRYCDGDGAIVYFPFWHVLNASGVGPELMHLIVLAVALLS